MIITVRRNSGQVPRIGGRDSWLNADQLVKSAYDFFVQTHNDRKANNREFIFGARKQTNGKELKMSIENQNNFNQDFVRQQNGEKPFDVAAMSRNAFPAGFQAIATAYGDYTKRAFEDSRSFVERLSSVRSVDKLVEAQTEFARTAYETFVEESQKIGAVYRDLAKQTYDGFVSNMPPTLRGPV